MNKKICLVCKKAQSAKRDTCFVKNCKGRLRNRKVYKRR